MLRTTWIILEFHDTCERIRVWLRTKVQWAQRTVFKRCNVDLGGKEN